MVVNTLGDLIATLGSIDNDEIDWQNIRQATVLIHQTFRYDYPSPITDLRQRLMVVPPDYHGHQRLATHKLRVSGSNLESERSYDSFGNVVLDLTLEEVDEHVEFTTWAVVESEIPLDGGESPDDLGTDRRFAEPSRLTKPDDQLRAVADELRASGATGLDLADLVCTRVHDHFVYEWGITNVETTAAEAWARRARRVPGLRPLHDRALPAVRPAGALRLGPPARRRRHARLGRGDGAGCERRSCARCRSTPRTTAASGRATSRSRSVATTPTCRPPRARSTGRRRAS